MVDSLIATDLLTIPCEEAVAERLAGVFSHIAGQLREARLVRRENERLREENGQLRQALGACIDACERYLATSLLAETPEDTDQALAQQALDEGRRLLARKRLAARF